MKPINNGDDHRDSPGREAAASNDDPAVTTTPGIQQEPAAP
ncbi:hypothetical protein [Halococcus sp. IIIV-5B]|nr:hypothetical protein [Halococcus sp. IIIV-5B]